MTRRSKEEGRCGHDVIIMKGPDVQSISFHEVEDGPVRGTTEQGVIEVGTDALVMKHGFRADECVVLEGGNQDAISKQQVAALLGRGGDIRA